MGACCVDIGLSWSPEQLRNGYENFLKRDGFESIQAGDQPDKMFDKYPQDIHLLFPMLKFIKSNHRHPEGANKKTENKIYHYSCKHFDHKKRICTIYEYRPKMCRTYPDKSVCKNPDCRWKLMIERRKSEK